MASNELRMPFAEWLFRMSEARLAPQARELAVYAVVFKVSSNEELARLAGMDTVVKGESIADKTYNRWKKELTDEGFVILRAVTKGRVTTIEVFPAFKECPVKFTDITPKLSRKFYGSKTYGETVDDTDEKQGSDVEVTDDSRNFDAPVVAPTDASHAPIRAQFETPSGLLKPKKLEEKSPFIPQDDEPRVTFENGRLELKRTEAVLARSVRRRAASEPRGDPSRGIHPGKFPEAA
jgi:hypothetical protein